MKEIFDFVLKYRLDVRLYFLYGFFFSSFFTPLAIYIGKRFGIIDKPRGKEERKKINMVPIPRSGGIAIYCSLVVLFLIIGNFSRQFIGIIIGATIIFVGMLIDDKRGLSVAQKFTLQFAAAFVAIFTGTKFIAVSNPLGEGMIQLGFLGTIFTVLWIVGVTNAINIIDGLDGLASGVATISSVFIAIIAMYKGNTSLAFLLLGLSGVLIAFLIYNFYPARIILGDSGAEILGFMLATISVAGAYKTATLISIVFPLLTLGIPITEVFTSIIRRLRSGTSPFKYDTDHIHYILLKKGWSQRRIASFYYFVTVMLSFVGVLLAFGFK